MALTTKRERAICKKYSAYDETGHVHCKECPLIKGDVTSYDFRCKANSYYDRKTREWVFNEGEDNDKRNIR